MASAIKSKVILDFIKQRKSSPLVIFIILFVYTAILIITALKHELWLDEIQSWLVADNLSWTEIFHHMRHEGHFVPWYYIILLMTYISNNPLSILIPSGLLMLCAVYLLLAYAPFKLVVKVLLIFSPQMLYFCPSISRCYALIPPLLFLLAVWEEEKNKKPLRYSLALGLLANTHSYMEGMVLILFCLFVYDTVIISWKRLDKYEKLYSLFPPLLVIASTFLAFIQVAPALGVQPNAQHLKFDFPKQLLNFCEGYCFYPCGTSSIVTSLASTITILLYLYIPLCLLAHRQYRNLLIIVVGAGWTFAFAIFLYAFLHPSQSYLVFIMFVFSLWLYEKKQLFQSPTPPVSSLFTIEWVKKIFRTEFLQLSLIVLIVLQFPGYHMLIHDWIRKISGIRSVGEFMNDNLPSNAIVAFYPSNHCLAMAGAYMNNKKYYNGITWEETKFFVLNRKNTSKGELSLNRIQSALDKRLPVYIVGSYGNKAKEDIMQLLHNAKPRAIEAKVIFSSDDTIYLRREKYYVYKIFYAEH